VVDPRFSDTSRIRTACLVHERGGLPEVWAGELVRRARITRRTFQAGLIFTLSKDLKRLLLV
jgi:hypothetical protein